MPEIRIKYFRRIITIIESIFKQSIFLTNAISNANQLFNINAYRFNMLITISEGRRAMEHLFQLSARLIFACLK